VRSAPLIHLSLTIGHHGYHPGVLRFLAIGEWDEASVTVERARSSHALPAELEEAVESAWRAAGARPGVRLFDGAMVRWESLQATAEQLAMRVSETSYRIFVGTNMAHPEWADRYGPQVMANPVGLSAALVSAEGDLLLGRRNANVAYYPQRLHPFAGSLEPAEATSPFAGLRRELEEELKLAERELAAMACIGVVEDSALRQGEMLFRVQARLGREAILARLDPIEHRAALAIAPTREAVETVLQRPHELTPVAAATILLWARPMIGHAWFETWRSRLVRA
jgi:8-oxo-dGTP pyrophosphatase MutT (NUDIX family)